MVMRDADGHAGGTLGVGALQGEGVLGGACACLQRADDSVVTGLSDLR
jgi:hypothetical protein